VVLLESQGCPQGFKAQGLCAWLPGDSLWNGFERIAAEANGEPIIRAHLSPLPCWRDGRIQCCQPLAPVTLRLGSVDHLVLFQIMHMMEYELVLRPEHFGLAAEPFHPDRVRFVLDAGANVGFASIFLATLYPNATVVALEADPGNYEAMVRNVEPYKNVVPIPRPLWDKKTNVSIVDGTRHAKEWDLMVVEQSDLAASTAGKSVGHTDAVESTTMVEVMREFGLPRVDLFKMDIEGSEFQVFRGEGVERWLPKVSVLIAELHDDMRPGSEQAVKDAIRRQRPHAAAVRVNDLHVFVLAEPGDAESEGEGRTLDAATGEASRDREVDDPGTDVKNPGTDGRAHAAGAAPDTDAGECNGDAHDGG
jgi:FkbM family methyltransferase